MPPVINLEKCVKCGQCADICPLEVFGCKPARGEAPVVRFPDECWHCNVCAQDCPRRGHNFAGSREPYDSSPGLPVSAKFEQGE